MRLILFPGSGILLLRQISAERERQRAVTEIVLDAIDAQGSDKDTGTDVEAGRPA